MEPKRQALTLIATGFCFSFACFLINGLFGEGHPDFARSLALGISLGHAILLVGCLRLAVAKGQHWAAGLLGLFSLVGVAILWFVIPDKSRSS